MISREELKEISGISAKDGYFASLYLNVDPVTDPGGGFVLRFKGMARESQDKLDRAAARSVENDLKDMEAYLLGNRREFKKGITVLSSSANNFWRVFHHSLPIKSEFVIERAPYIKPLLDLMDNYRRYAVLLVEKDKARIFVVHLGEITEFGEVHTPDVPGRHKKGGWYALAQTHYDRHTKHHVTLHLKDVIKRLESFLGGEDIGRLFLGGSDEAVSITRKILPKDISDKVIATFSAGMFETNKEIMEKVGPLLEEYESRRQVNTVGELIARAHKNDRAVLGLDGVIEGVLEGKVMRLVFERDFKYPGFECSACGGLSLKDDKTCPYCSGDMRKVNYFVDLAAQKAVEQGAMVEVVHPIEEFRKEGRIGAFLRF